MYWMFGADSTIDTLWPAFAREMETVRPARPQPITMMCCGVVSCFHNMIKCLSGNL